VGVFQDGIRHFFTKVVGVTHRNRDGSNRQEIIKRCEPDERLLLEHEEDNPKDPNAVRVCRRNGEQLGYLASDLVKRIVNEMERGCRHVAYITDLTGGESDKPTRGVNLLIVVAEPGVTSKEIQDYADGVETNESPSRSGCRRTLALMVLVISAACLAIVGLVGHFL
jgi:hypothetical protein